MLTTKLRVLDSAPGPVRPRQRVRFHLGTAEVLGRVALLDAPEIRPGDERWVQLRLEAPVVARAGDRFVIRSYSPATTIAGGIIGEPLPEKRKRLSGADLEMLETMLAAPAAEAIGACVRARAHRGMPRDLLPIFLPFSTSTIDDALRTHHDVKLLDALVVHADAVDDMRARLRDAVDRQHRKDPAAPGEAMDELRRLAPAGTAPALFDWALRSLVADGELVQEGLTVRRAGFAPRLDPDQEAAAVRLTDLLTRAALTPPLLSELPPDLRDRPDLPRLVRFLERRGDLTQVAPGLWMAAQAFRAAVDLAFDRFGDRPDLTPGDFKDLYGITRKYLIPLLEHFDRTGVTVRHGDLRNLARA
jgi:selenocysteine-specific elongation factor